MVWSWSSMATASKSSLVLPRYHCPTIGLIAFILPAPHCCARLHSTTNDSFAQYVYFARSNIARDSRRRMSRCRLELGICQVPHTMAQALAASLEARRRPEIRPRHIGAVRAQRGEMRIGIAHRQHLFRIVLPVRGETQYSA